MKSLAASFKDVVQFQVDVRRVRPLVAQASCDWADRPSLCGPGPRALEHIVLSSTA